MKLEMVNVDNLILHNEESGDEVGFPNIEIVGLYQGIGEKSNILYYVNSVNGEVLEVFEIEE